jgi:intracellular septation protein
MTQRKISPALKTALDLGPVLAYFGAYLLLKDRTFTLFGQEWSGFIAVTAAFIPLIVATTLLTWRLTGTLSRMQLVTMVLVVIFGGLSVWLNDERFFKIKPTIVYLIFAGILGFGLWRGKSFLETVMGQALPLRPEAWMILTRRITALFVALAVANEAVWRLASTETWVTFETFVPPVVLFAFFMAHARLIESHALPEGERKD